jgi:chromatin remodeling complex protein RSC6
MTKVNGTIENTVLDKFPQFTKILNDLDYLKNNLQKNVLVVKKLQKNVEKEFNNKKKKKETNTKRKPSGFAKPSSISPELCEFLSLPEGTEIARTQVTKSIANYIKEKELQDPQNKRTIKPDKKLHKLLKTTTKDEVTYFNLQRYMKIHFPKSKSS